MIGCDMNMSNGKIKAEILLQHWNGYQQELEVKGKLVSMETEPLGIFGRRTTLVVENDGDLYIKEHLNCRCNIVKENKTMPVKIKKQPKEITLEELKQGNEYEEVNIYIDVDKQDEIEKKYGITYRYGDVISSDMFNESNSEINFKEHYLIYGREKVPYDFITKIEVVEK